MIHELLGDKALANTGLSQLKAAFSTFSANKQKFPLTHESKRSKVLHSVVLC